LYRCDAATNKLVRNPGFALPMELFPVEAWGFSRTNETARIKGL
jgi:hypothetical protein